MKHELFSIHSLLNKTNLGTLTLASGSAENLDASSECDSSLIHGGF